MPPARPIYEDDTLFLTRRVDHRENRLRPDVEVTQVLGYLLAVLSKEHDIRLCALCVLGTHYHALTHDLSALTPKFTQTFHAFAARAINKIFGEEGRLWNGQQTSHVRPEEPSDILDRIVYTLVNPIRAGMVESRDEYPGLCMAWGDAPRTFKRPDVFFDPRAKNPDGTQRWPEYATLEMHRPAGFDELSDEALAAELERRFRISAEAACVEVEEKGRTFLGAEGIFSIPRSFRFTSEERPGPSPTVAAKNAILRLARLAFNRVWRIKHADARRRRNAGEGDVEFPYGTYLMRVQHNVRVARAPG